MEIKENTISILVNNKPDVMARIAGTFSGRGFNIETIAVNITKDSNISKIILTIFGNQDTITKIEKQLNRMLDVIQVEDLTSSEAVKREMILVRLKTDKERTSQLMQTIDTYKWKVVSTSPDYCIVEITGHKDDIENALAILEPLGIDDFTRTGVVALARNNKERG